MQKINLIYQQKTYLINLEETAIKSSADTAHAITINQKSYRVAPIENPEIPVPIKNLLQGLGNQHFESIDAFEAALTTSISSLQETTQSVYESKIHDRDPMLTTMSSKIDTLLQEATEKDHFRGFALIIRDRKPLLSKGYGVANEQGAEITEKTIFHLGSLTKQFTATAILLLEQDGKLKVQDPIKKHLPAELYDDKWDEITIHQLLTHTSGLPDFDESFYSLTEPQTIGQYIDHFKRKSLDFTPGTAYNYVNSGYQLLGVIIDHVSGRTYGDFVQERIFSPCHMTSSGCGNTYPIGQVAQGYDRNEEGTITNEGPLSETPNQGSYLVNAYSGGGLYSNAEDLQKWDAILYGSALLTPESKTKMFHPVNLPIYSLASEEKPFLSNYGYGVHVGKDPDLGACISHGGQIRGFQTLLSRYPERQDSIIILSNNYNIDLTAIWINTENTLAQRSI